MPNKRYVYVGVRTDLPLAQQIVQSNHAAYEAGHAFPRPPEPAHLVLLAIPDQTALLTWADRLQAAGIQHEIFFEPDDDAGYTAFATEPLTSDHRRHFRKGKLWAPPGRVLA